MRARPSGALVAVAATALLIVANLFAAAYVHSEHYIYSWDWAGFWLRFQSLGPEMLTHPLRAVADIGSSLATEDYNLLPVVPLTPFEWLFGPGRLPYILAITNVALIPGAALMAWVSERTAERPSWPRFLVCTATLLSFHMLWAPVLRGMPDVLGIAVACLVLLTYFGRGIESRLVRLVGLGALMCLLVLIRRWYVFWAASFFPAAALAYVMASGRDELRWKNMLGRARELAIAGAICVALLLAIAGPLIARVATTDYSAAYAAYRPDLLGEGRFSQIVDHFGIAPILLAMLGLGCLVVRKSSRELGILLTAQAVIALVLFTHVQQMLGVQHYCVLIPATGIAIAGLIASLWNTPWRLGWRAAAIAAVPGVLLLSSLVVFLPGRAGGSPLLPTSRYPPLVRSDLPELDRLMDELTRLRPRLVYVVSSSELLNWDTLHVGCQGKHEALCSHVAVTADIDARDGFPARILRADYVVLASPTQYHARPEDQQVIGVVADHIRERTGIGSSFEPLPGEFVLMNGVRVRVYRRTAPFRPQDVQAFSDELIQSDGQLRKMFDQSRRARD
jgi:hypothetical protein